VPCRSTSRARLGLVYKRPPVGGRAETGTDHSRFFSSENVGPQVGLFFEAYCPERTVSAGVDIAAAPLSDGSSSPTALL
jgi:hypothetical protein